MPVEQDVESTIALVAETVKEGKCILFLGAGVHAPPEADSPFDYPEEQRPPMGSALSEELARTSGLAAQFPDEDPRNLQRVALFYEIARSRRQLVDAVAGAVQTGKRPSPLLGALAELDFPLVITTNYDHHFENALRAVGKDPCVSVYTPDDNEKTADFPDPSPQSPVIYKIHGDISSPETLVVTDEDYIQFVLRMSNKEPYDPVPLTLKFHLARCTTLFVGYSLLDYNLRLLFKALRWRMDSARVPDMYSIDHAPDPLIFDVWQHQRRYVKFIAQDSWAFVPRLYEAVLGRELTP